MDTTVLTETAWVRSHESRWKSIRSASVHDTRQEQKKETTTHTGATAPAGRDTPNGSKADSPFCVVLKTYHLTGYYHNASLKHVNFLNRNTVCTIVTHMEKIADSLYVFPFLFLPNLWALFVAFSCLLTSLLLFLILFFSQWFFLFFSLHGSSPCVCSPCVYLLSLLFLLFVFSPFFFWRNLFFWLSFIL